MTMQLHVRTRARRVGLALGVVVLLPTFLAPSTAGAAGVCSSLERMVWTGDAFPERRQVVVGTPGNPTPVVISAGISTENSEPAISPDHGRIAWSGRHVGTGQFEVFVADGDGSNVRRVAPGVTSESKTTYFGPIEGIAPDWAPLGERLAWADGSGTSIHFTDLQGGPVSSIVSPMRGRGPQWSPNGLRLAWFVDGPGNVVIAAAANGAPIDATRLTLGLESLTREWPRNNFAWAPDSRRVAVFGAINFTGGELNLGPTTLGLYGGITEYGPGHWAAPGFTNHVLQRPQWAPDGSGLAWAQVMGAPGGLMGEHDEWGAASLVNGSSVSQMETRDMSFSPDGSRVVSSDWRTVTAVAGSSGAGAIKVRDRQGNVVASLTQWQPFPNYGRVDVAPAWSPRGDRIAWEAQRWVTGVDSNGFTHSSYANSRLAIRAADGSGPTTFLEAGGAPVWSPSAHFIGTSLRSDGVRSADSYTGVGTTFTGPVRDVSAVHWTSAASTNLLLRTGVSTTSVAAGDTFGLDVDVENWGPCGAGAVTVADLVPIGVTVVSATPSTGSTYGGVWSLDRVRLGAAAHLHLELRAPATPGVVQERPLVVSDTADTFKLDNTAPWSITVT